MLEFKSAEDLSKISPDDPAFTIVEDLVKCLITDYIADDDGWISCHHVAFILGKPS